MAAFDINANDEANETNDQYKDPEDNNIPCQDEIHIVHNQHSAETISITSAEKYLN